MGSTGSGYSPRALDTLSPTAARWLDARGLDSDLCSKLGLTSAAGLGIGEWISIPTVCRGHVVNHKYRRLDEKDFRQDKGGVQTWWNHDALLDPTLREHPLVITEGEMDAIAAMQAGFLRVISVPGGAPKDASEGDSQRYRFLADTLPLLADIAPIIIASDGDAAGGALMVDLAVRLGKGRCRYVTYPNGCKDLNDTLLGYGTLAVGDAINSAKWCKVSGLFTMGGLPPLAEAEPLSIGIPGLYDHYRIRKGDFAVMTGIPGMGKSTVVNDIACRMVKNHKWHVCFASFEQSPRGDHLRALRTWVAQSPARGLNAEETAYADAWIEKNFSFIVPDDEEDATIDWLLEKMAASIVRYGTQLCIVDPWNELDHARPKDQTLTEYVNWAIKEMKRFAKRWNIHLIVVAHPTKLSRQADGKLPIPSMYDISDSSAWANKADVGVIVHRDGPLTVVRVAKSRYHQEIGTPGSINLQFIPSTARFEAP